MMHGFYNLPTIELCEFLKNIIKDIPTIEIGAGHGALGKYLGVLTTDSYLHDQPIIQEYYKSINQPTVKYPKHVIRLDAEKAILEYNPKIVIGSWITQILRTDDPHPVGNMYGVDEESIIENH